MKAEVHYQFFRFLLISTLILIVFLFAVYGMKHIQMTTSLRSYGLTVLNPIPDFLLTDQNNEEFPSSKLAGKVWVADFVFTRCAGPCPQMTIAMQKLQREFLNEKELHWISFSADPLWDKPEKLKAYEKKFNLNPQNWSFLTGDKQTIFDLSIKHFRLGLADADANANPIPDQVVIHSTKFVLVDKLGRIRGFYSSEESAAMNQLRKDIRFLLKES